MLRLDGISCLVQTPQGSEDAIYNGKDLTLSAWIRPATVVGARGIFALLDGDGQDLDNKKGKTRLLVEIRDGKLCFSFLATNGQMKTGETDPVLKENVWQHLTVTFKDNGKIIGLWLNGKLVREFANNSPAVPMGNYWTRDFLFGKKTFDTAVEDGFSGDVDEVLLYSQALSAEEMAKQP